MWTEVDFARAPVHDWPPRWCSAWGDDRFGAWAAFEVNGVEQQMRWIEPGSFRLGSLANEAGRDYDEGQQHRVKLSRGYWLADTPCTQGLWRAVMGWDPSGFKDEADNLQRPVEKVSWDDVHGFMQKLQSQLPAAGVVELPSEAQWEYACRAGPMNAYAWGEEMDRARANVDGEFGGSKAVKRFEPSGWGLYDMHGNVLEWCRDAMRDYGVDAVVDPERPISNLMRSERRAIRLRWLRDGRSDELRFRLTLRSTSPEGAEREAAGGPGLKARSERAPLFFPRPSGTGKARGPVESRLVHVRWPAAHRLIPSRHPTSSLFDAVSTTEDLETLLALEKMSNPRVGNHVGRRAPVLQGDHVSGPDGVLLMSAFTHLNPIGSVFSDGAYGVLYGARDLETAKAETLYHHEQFLQRTSEPTGMGLVLRLVTFKIDGWLYDVRGDENIAPLREDSLGANRARELGRQLHASGAAGIVFSSARQPEGESVALFSPQVASNAVAGPLFRFIWTGTKLIPPA